MAGVVRPTTDDTALPDRPPRTPVQHTPVQHTPDARYIIVRGRLWCAANPALEPAERQRYVDALMAARRAVGLSRTEEDRRRARAAVDAAKHRLGERGPVWWTDGVPDQNRRLVKNSSYAEWFETLG